MEMRMGVVEEYRGVAAEVVAKLGNNENDFTGVATKLMCHLPDDVSTMTSKDGQRALKALFSAPKVIKNATKIWEVMNQEEILAPSHREKVRAQLRHWGWDI
jgi:soluble P-type ATPase